MKCDEDFLSEGKGQVGEEHLPDEFNLEFTSNSLFFKREGRAYKTA